MDSDFPMNRPERRTSSPDDRQALGADGRREEIPSWQARYHLSEIFKRGCHSGESLAVADAKDAELVDLRKAVASTSWQDAVIDQCAVACLDGDFSDPRATLARLITWHVQMALDPRISEAAAALVLATKVEALEWAATQCDDTAKSAARMAREGGTSFDDGREHAAQELAAEMRAGKGYTS